MTNTHTSKLYAVIFSCTTKEQAQGAERFLNLWANHNRQMARTYSIGRCMGRHYDIEDTVKACKEFLNKLS